MRPPRRGAVDPELVDFFLAIIQFYPARDSMSQPDGFHMRILVPVFGRYPIGELCSLSTLAARLRV